MDKLSQSQTVGIVALLTVITGVVGWTALHSGASADAHAITFRDAPGPAPGSVTPIPAGNAVPAPDSDDVPTAGDHSPNVATAPSPAGEIIVHVAGAVRKPGVYHLHAGARNDDALKAAGGPNANANTDAVNLAAHAEDGTQLYIPTHKEQPDGGAQAPSVSSSSSTPAAPPVPAHKTRREPASVARTGAGGSRTSHSDKLTDPSQGQININTAGAQELQKLPGVGPAMAARLIAYRTENGSFHAIEDLMQVSGIGEKKFARMQPFVRVR